MKGYFITGTDTGVGKTFVGVALVRRARELGQKVFAFKPIETGVVPGRDGEDQQLLCDAAGGWQRDELRGVYRFKQAAAPRVAAEAENVGIDFQKIEAVYRDGLREGVDLVVVEGAGGWRVPITDASDTSGLAELVGLPVVVVARAGLGTINHSLLSLEAIERDGCSVAALVLSVRHDDDRIFARSNEQEIRARWPGRIIYFLQPSDLDPLL